MPVELRPLVRRLGLRREGPGPGGLHRGRVGRFDVVAALTGIGTRAAARAAERLLDATAADHLVVVGIAGGIGPGVRIGDVVVPELVVDRASGAEHRPDPLGALAARGTLLTSDELLAGAGEIADLARRGVIAVDMETAAVAAVCERRGCRWSVVRAISDRADDASVDAAVLGLARPDGSADLPAVARFLLRRPAQITGLVRLARGMQRAIDAAARCVAEALERGSQGAP
jgi:adenosylhomocysteine nucleosidase